MAKAPALEVHGVLQAQWEREARGEQAAGHLVKVLSLFAHAAVRYALWAAGQVPEYVVLLTQAARYTRAARALRAGRARGGRGSACAGSILRGVWGGAWRRAAGDPRRASARDRRARACERAARGTAVWRVCIDPKRRATPRAPRGGARRVAPLCQGGVGVVARGRARAGSFEHARLAGCRDAAQKSRGAPRAQTRAPLHDARGDAGTICAYWTYTYPPPRTAHAARVRMDAAAALACAARRCTAA